MVEVFHGQDCETLEARGTEDRSTVMFQVSGWNNSGKGASPTTLEICTGCGDGRGWDSVGCCYRSLFI